MQKIANNEVLHPSVRWNPHPLYAQMRKETPISKMPYFEMGAYPWLLTRYDDCMFLQTDERFTKNFERVDNSGMYKDSPIAVINRHLLTLDPPDHTRLRSLVHKAFTPRIIQLMTDRVQNIANTLLDAMQEHDEVDLLSSYAFQIPIIVIAELLGVPPSDRDSFRRWSHTILFGAVRQENMDEMMTAAMEFIGYFHGMFDLRRADPKEDLITNLVQAEEAGDKLQPQELISMVFLLLLAGHETTLNLISNGTLALLQHPDQLQLLRENPDLIKTAVEEMLRYDGPIGASTMRWALEDMEIRGQKIQTGEMVLASLLAANRDPEVFENPDTFDIRRTPNKHMAFGYGIHYCVGAPLARMEGAIAINSLIHRFPKLGLAVEPQSLEWNETVLIRSMTKFPVRLK
jgi:cytochrome P450